MAVTLNDGVGNTTEFLEQGLVFSCKC